MPAALTLILICPSPGSRSGTPAHFSTSGGPYPVITTALGIAIPSFLVAAAIWPRTVTAACSWCALSCSTDRALRRGRYFPPPLSGHISGACWRRADDRQCRSARHRTGSLRQQKWVVHHSPRLQSWQVDALA